MIITGAKLKGGARGASHPPKLTPVGHSDFFNITVGQIDVKESNEKNWFYHSNCMCFTCP